MFISLLLYCFFIGCGFSQELALTIIDSDNITSLPEHIKFKVVKYIEHINLESYRNFGSTNRNFYILIANYDRRFFTKTRAYKYLHKNFRFLSLFITALKPQILKITALPALPSSDLKSDILEKLSEFSKTAEINFFTGFNYFHISKNMQDIESDYYKGNVNIVKNFQQNPYIPDKAYLLFRQLLQKILPLIHNHREFYDHYRLAYNQLMFQKVIYYVIEQIRNWNLSQYEFLEQYGKSLEMPLAYFQVLQDLKTLHNSKQTSKIAAICECYISPDFRGESIMEGKNLIEFEHLLTTMRQEIAIVDHSLKNSPEKRDLIFINLRQKLHTCLNEKFKNIRRPYVAEISEKQATYQNMVKTFLTEQKKRIERLKTYSIGKQLPIDFMEQLQAQEKSICLEEQKCNQEDKDFQELRSKLSKLDDEGIYWFHLLEERLNALKQIIMSEKQMAKKINVNINTLIDMEKHMSSEIDFLEYELEVYIAKNFQPMESKISN